MEYVDYDKILDNDSSKMDRLVVASKLKDLPISKESNISPHALGMSIRMDLEKRRNTQTMIERQMMLDRNVYNIIKIPEKIKEAIDILKKLENNTNVMIFREALATRMELRNLSLKNFSRRNYSSALLQSHYSLLLARKFHMEMRKIPLSGEMAMELLILSKCYSLIEQYDKGIEYLNELKYIIEYNILNLIKDEDKLNEDMKYLIINCDENVFPNIVYSLGELLSNYGKWDEAEIIFSKYLILSSKLYGDDNIKMVNIINSVIIYMLRCKQYIKALPLSIKSLNILKNIMEIILKIMIN